MKYAILTSLLLTLLFTSCHPNRDKIITENGESYLALQQKLNIPENENLINQLIVNLGDLSVMTYDQLELMKQYVVTIKRKPIASFLEEYSINDHSTYFQAISPINQLITKVEATIAFHPTDIHFEQYNEVRKLIQEDPSLIDEIINSGEITAEQKMAIEYQFNLIQANEDLNDFLKNSLVSEEEFGTAMEEISTALSTFKLVKQLEDLGLDLEEEL